MFISYQKKDFKSVSTKENIAGIISINKQKVKISKRMEGKFDILFIVHFYLGKYSFHESQYLLNTCVCISSYIYIYIEREREKNHCGIVATM